MTGPYRDQCPACGSNEVTPYAVIIGGSEDYGYQCDDCAVSWPVLIHVDPPAPVRADGTTAA